MAKRHLKKALNSLTAEGFSEFCDALVDNTSIQVASVEGKGRLEIATLMVNTFTEDEAVKTAVEILKEISCNKIATDLAKDAGVGQDAGVGRACPPAGCRPGAAMHFVDRHQEDLVEKVFSVDAILDRLWMRKAITADFYNETKALPTAQKKMMALYTGPLQVNSIKDVFLDVLQKQQPHLIAELQGK